MSVTTSPRREYDPFNIRSRREPDGVVSVAPGNSKTPEQFMIRREEVGHVLSATNKPVPSVSDAETHASRGMAEVLAQRAERMHGGTWKAVAAPSPVSDDDLPDAA